MIYNNHVLCGELKGVLHGSVECRPRIKKSRRRSDEVNHLMYVVG